MTRFVIRIRDRCELFVAAALLVCARRLLQMTLAVFLRGWMDRTEARFFIRIAHHVAKSASHIITRQMKRLSLRARSH